MTLSRFGQMFYIIKNNSVRLQLLKKYLVIKALDIISKTFKFSCPWIIVLKILVWRTIVLKRWVQKPLSLTLWKLPAPPQPPRELHKLYFCCTFEEIWHVGNTLHKCHLCIFCFWFFADNFLPQLYQKRITVAVFMLTRPMCTRILSSQE